MATYICKCPVSQVIKRFSGVIPKTAGRLFILRRPHLLFFIMASHGGIRLMEFATIRTLPIAMHGERFWYISKGSAGLAL